MTNRSMSLFFILTDCCSDIFLYKKRSGFLFNFRKDTSLIKFILSPKNICFDLEKKKEEEKVFKSVISKALECTAGDSY